MTLHHGDCLDILPVIPDASVDAIIADPPYGTTACKWDAVIPFEPMWRELRRVIKTAGAIVLFASQPFTTALAASNMAMFRYTWVWDKAIPSGFNYARFQPMRRHEDILVFYDKAPYYDAQGEPYETPIKYKMAHSPSDSSHMTHSRAGEYTTATHRKKNSIIQIPKVRRGLHPTQKPVALIEYLIRTYTKEGDVVLDFTMGSGTTGVAAVNTGREFIGIELDEGYYNIARERIANSRGR